MFSFSTSDRILVVAPHPDDESLATAGLLQRMFAQKVAVRILYATNGDNNPWAQRYWERRWRIGPTERIRWGRYRCEEALAAITVLGGGRDCAKFMNLPDLGTTARSSLDGSSFSIDRAGARQRYGRVMRRVFVTREGTGHPDPLILTPL